MDKTPTKRRSPAKVIHVPDDVDKTPTKKRSPPKGIYVQDSDEEMHVTNGDGPDESDSAEKVRRGQAAFDKAMYITFLICILYPLIILV